MDTSTIREAVLKRPFQPFTLRMNDGREYHIPHPEWVAVSKRVVFVVAPATEAGVLLEPLLIASLHYYGGAPKPADANTGGNS